MRCYHPAKRSHSAKGLSRTTRPSKDRGSIWRRSSSRRCRSSVLIDAFRRSTTYVGPCWRGQIHAISTVKRSTGPSPRTMPAANCKDTITMSKNLIERPLITIHYVLKHYHRPEHFAALHLVERLFYVIHRDCLTDEQVEVEPALQIEV